MSPTVPTDARPGPRFRASDVERMAVAQVLQDATARGLLTPDEGSDRTGAAFAAVFRDELPPLTADLPPVPGDTTTRQAPRGALSWARARAVAVGMWLWLLTMLSRWSPRKRVLAASAVGVVLLLVGFGVVGVFGVFGEEHGFDGGGMEHLHR